MFSIRAGTSYRNRDGKEFAVNHTIQHPLYNSSTNDYDVAVVTVAEPLVGKNIQPIPISDDLLNNSVGRLGIISGWGYLSVKSIKPVYIKIGLISIKIYL